MQIQKCLAFDFSIADQQIKSPLYLGDKKGHRVLLNGSVFCKKITLKTHSIPTEYYDDRSHYTALSTMYSIFSKWFFSL